MPLLEVRGLVVRYGEITAVHGIDLTLEEGEIGVLLGSNGAGKSSTLNAISGAVPAAAGEMRFDGADITRWPAHKVSQAGLLQVPEGRRVIAPMTVRENLSLGAYQTRSKTRRAELEGMVDAMFPQLAELADRPSGLLSGGEQQMLAFARALMGDPKLMMLDEPSMGLAPIIVDRVVDAVREIAARGISILMVEQNAAAAFAIATTAYVLEHGEITLRGSAEDVRSHPLTVRAFLGIEPDSHVEEPSTTVTENSIKQTTGP
jgi:branched-chain amino acid transport system ATP-binding protein